MPEYQPRAKTETADAIASAYLDCAEWCGLDDEAREAFELAVSPRWTREAIQAAEAIAREFRAEFPSERWGLDDVAQSQVGHDLWLTRNRHGAGFWDGDWVEPFATKATEWTHAWGEASMVFDAEAETLAFL